MRKSKVFLEEATQMRAVGIVCEYNPFHRGHLYQMEESRRLCGDALIV